MNQFYININLYPIIRFPFGWRGIEPIQHHFLLRRLPTSLPFRRSRHQLES